MMTVTVFYNGKKDDVFENVTHISTFVKEKEEKVLRIHFWDEDARRTQLIYMDANTEVRITFLAQMAPRARVSPVEPF